MKASTKPAKPKSKTVALSVSPSAWMVWEKCALSLQSVKSPFMLERDEHALEGKRLHSLIEKTLKGENTVVEGDDAAIVRFAVETALSEMRGKDGDSIESPVAALVDGVNFSGIVDCDCIDGDTIIINDFKTGWREVEAEGNSQLKIYAHGRAKKNPAIKNWKGIIINARFNSVSYTGGVIDPNYLSKTAKDIKERTAKKQFKTGNHCAYCQRLSTCAKIRADIQKWLVPGAIDGITREPERLAEALRLAKPAEKLFETIKKEAQLFIDLGGAIPGVSVEYTAGTRAWPRDMIVDDIADKIGVDTKKMFESSIISPAKAEKIGANKEAVNAIAIRPPRKGFKFN